MSLPEPIDAAVAAASIYVQDPADDARAVRAVVQKMGWSEDHTRSWLTQHRAAILELVGEIQTDATELGVSLAQAAALGAFQAQRMVDLNTRRVALMLEIADLIPDDGKTVQEVISQEQMLALFQKHGLTLSEHGELELAADAG